MNKWLKVVLIVFAVASLTLAADQLLFKESYTVKVADTVKLTFDKEARDIKKIDNAQFDPSLEPGEVNEILTELIDGAEDDLVYEKALREQSRNLESSDLHESLQYTVRLATDSRVRAPARAGAIEQLAIYYEYQYLPVEELDEHIFSNSIFADLKKGSADSNQVILLEYANDVANRALVTAMLVRHYARELKVGDVEASKKLDDTITLYHKLFEIIPPESPSAPVTATFFAAGLLYLFEADKDNPDILKKGFPDLEMAHAIKTSEAIRASELESFKAANIVYDREDFLLRLYAPPALFITIFKTISEVEKTQFSESIADLAVTYIKSETEAGINFEDKMPNLYRSMKSLVNKYPQFNEVL